MHPQPRVQSRKHTSVVTTVTPDSPGIPYAMVLRLIPCSPRRRIRLVTVIGGLRVVGSRSGRRASANLTPATGARTTRLCRPQLSSFVCSPFDRSQAEACPAITSRADAAASTASHPASVTIASAPLGDETARLIEVIWVRREWKYFWKWGWTAERLICPSGSRVSGSNKSQASSARIGLAAERHGACQGSCNKRHVYRPAKCYDVRSGRGENSASRMHALS